MIVLDTSVLVDNLRDLTGAGDALDGAVDRGEGLVASVVSKVELLGGMRSRERRPTRQLIDRLTWVPVSDDIAEQAGDYVRRFRRSHTGIDLADFLIGATSAVLEAELWTRNVRHFPMFPKLASPY
jgi:predicted nucleic acid-binding protein